MSINDLRYQEDRQLRTRLEAAEAIVHQVQVDGIVSKLPHTNSCWNNRGVSSLSCECFKSRLAALSADSLESGKAALEVTTAWNLALGDPQDFASNQRLVAALDRLAAVLKGDR